MDDVIVAALRTDHTEGFSNNHCYSTGTFPLGSSVSSFSILKSLQPRWKNHLQSYKWKLFVIRLGPGVRYSFLGRHRGGGDHEQAQFKIDFSVRQDPRQIDRHSFIHTE